MDAAYYARQATESRVCGELARQIANRIAELGLMQAQAARRMGASPSHVSKIVNGRFWGYSADRMIAFLTALGVDVQIVIRPPKPASRRRRGVLSFREMASR